MDLLCISKVSLLFGALGGFWGGLRLRHSGTGVVLRRLFRRGFRRGFRAGFRDTWHSPKVSEGGSVGGFEGGIRQGFGTAPTGFSGHAGHSEGLRKGVLQGGTSRRGLRRRLRR